MYVMSNMLVGFQVANPGSCLMRCKFQARCQKYKDKCQVSSILVRCKGQVKKGFTFGPGMSMQETMKIVFGQVLESVWAKSESSVITKTPVMARLKYIQSWPAEATKQ
jgi:hypothetical protein